jgi:mannose-6-phosphate isomerase-like protein (cupin superfamily)
MHVFHLARFIFVIIVPICLETALGQTASPLKKTSLTEIADKQKQTHITETEFLNEGTLQGIFYHLEKDAGLPKTKNEYDAVYYIVKGDADININNRLFPVSKDSIFYIHAGNPFSMINIRNTLEIISFVSTCPAKQQDTDWSVFALSNIERPRNPGANAWNPFFKKKTFTFGLYMLPEKTGGDSSLVHLFDEVNLISKGSGKFSVGEQLMDVREGDIIYVRKGNGHFFHNLDRDLDILIFFEKKSVYTNQ